MSASRAAAQVPLVSFATLKRTTAPLSIAHQEQFPADTISFDLPEGRRSARRCSASARSSGTSACRPSVVGVFGADAAEFTKSLAGEPWLILAAVVTIYLVLGVLYESFIHPLTILSTLPSAGVGAILALILCKQELSIVALIGIILLMGIVKKNAIMMIDFATAAEREEGLIALRRHRARLPAALPPHHDDDARGAVRRHPAGLRARHRRRTARAARHHHHRRPAASASC